MTLPTHDGINPKRLNLEKLIAQEDFTITLSDAREFHQGCVAGWKEFSVTHGFLWESVVCRGLLASELLETKDAMAIALIIYVYNKRNPSG